MYFSYKYKKGCKLLHGGKKVVLVRLTHVFANQGLVWLCSLVGDTLTFHLKKQLKNKLISTDPSHGESSAT